MNAETRSRPQIRVAWLSTKTAKWIVGIVLAIPFVLLLNDVRIELIQPGAGLGPDPGEALVDRLGTWSIRILYLTLLVSSVARLLKVPVLIQHRRTFGLWAFTYVVLHLAAYFSALAGFDLNVVLGDFSKRPYIIVGLVALCLLIPLAITSTRGWQRRLGLNWRRLHRIVYVAAILALIHLWMQEKASFFDTFMYGSILFLLFIERLVGAVQRLRRKSVATQAAGEST
ncbi:MAG: sulfoxide reductase heme-binding subunit YedZ [Gammaproteobacteria bacterium]|nr:sulfoxide reductase heme-binding subunit YedZ [Gammaproteobacteria bacterium]